MLNFSSYSACRAAYIIALQKRRIIKMLSRRSLLGRLLAAGVIAAPIVANIMPSEVEALEAPSGGAPEPAAAGDKRPRSRRRRRRVARVHRRPMRHKQ
jgi:hypothetical protein